MNTPSRIATARRSSTLALCLMLLGSSGCGHPDAGSLDLSQKTPAPEELLGPDAAKLKKKSRSTPPLDLAP
jgi:hypothetical protein